MEKLPLIGLGIATIGSSGQTLDVHFPFVVFSNGNGEHDHAYGSWDALMDQNTISLKDPSVIDLKDNGFNSIAANLSDNKKLVLCRIVEDQKIKTVEEAYLKLHLLSYKFFKPNSLNLDNLFNALPNVAWTNRGPVELEDINALIINAKAKNKNLEIKSVDKFPRLTDYIIPPGVRIADTSRVRLGAYLSEGTTVMHEGFVNFNSGTMGAAMIEGRISAGVIVGKDSDLGGGCSTMGTLSGGNEIKISIGKNCLLGANSGLGIPLGDNCIIEAGLYVTGGSKVKKFNAKNESEGTVKAADLSGKDNLLFIRNSLTGAIEARMNLKSVTLNKSLHDNQ
jgi:2,3,4,5-tetrahydropyridine-2,6-dicarboxylate N-succinyltransferase